MTIYTDLGGVSNELIAEFGLAVTTRRITSSTFDPVTSEAVNTYETIVRKGLLTGVDKRFIDSSSSGNMNSGTVLITDQMVVFGADGETFETDEIMVGGIKYAIIRIVPVAPGGEAVLWKVVVRR